jgi:hypothetical protein
MDLTKPINWPIQPESPVVIPPPKCSKCGGEMEEGFIVDYYYNNSKDISTWVAGKPEHGLFGTIKTAFKQQQYIRTFACMECGYLESYIKRPKPV